LLLVWTGLNGGRPNLAERASLKASVARPATVTGIVGLLFVHLSAPTGLMYLKF